MKHRVTINLTIDTDDYDDLKDDPKAVWDLVGSMLDGEADMPEVAAVTVDCSRTVNWRRKY